MTVEQASREELEYAVKQLATDLAGWTFRGKNLSLGEEAENHVDRVLAWASDRAIRTDDTTGR